MAKLKQRHSAPKFAIGDRVRLRKDVLVRHSKSIPASAGFTSTDFRWRKVLTEQAGRVGTVTRLFPNSDHTNVRFRGGPTIGIGRTDLVKVVRTRK